jgi:hypothetical protein
MQMATFQGCYFQTAFDAIEQFDHAETASVLCKQLAKAVSCFGLPIFVRYFGADAPAAHL